MISGRLQSTVIPKERRRRPPPRPFPFFLAGLYAFTSTVVPAAPLQAGDRQVAWGPRPVQHSEWATDAREGDYFSPRRIRERVEKQDAMIARINARFASVQGRQAPAPPPPDAFRQSLEKFMIGDQMSAEVEAKRAQSSQALARAGGYSYKAFPDGRRVWFNKDGRAHRVENEKITDADGRVSIRDTTDMAYDAKGNLLSSKTETRDPEGHITVTHWSGVYEQGPDGKDNLSAFTENTWDPLGNATKTERSSIAYGGGKDGRQPVSYKETQTDALGRVTVRNVSASRYDDENRLLSYSETFTDSLGETSSKKWTASGYIKNPAHKGENSSEPRHLLSGYTEETTDSRGRQSVKEWKDARYNDQGRVTSWTEDVKTQTPSGGWVSTRREWTGGKYDARGRLVSYRETTTDENGVFRRTDVKNTAYDDFGRMLSYDEVATDSQGAKTRRRWHGAEYNAKGELLAYSQTVVESGQERLTRWQSLGYDGQGRSLGHRETGKVLEDGALLYETEDVWQAGENESHDGAYDAKGRVLAYHQTTRRVFADGTEEKDVRLWNGAVYDAEGRLTGYEEESALSVTRDGVTETSTVRRRRENTVYYAEAGGRGEGRHFGQAAGYTDVILDDADPDKVRRSVVSDILYDEHGRQVSSQTAGAESERLNEALRLAPDALSADAQRAGAARALWNRLAAATAGLASRVVDWFKEKLGLESSAPAGDSPAETSGGSAPLLESLSRLFSGGPSVPSDAASLERLRGLLQRHLPGRPLSDLPAGLAPAARSLGAFDGGLSVTRQADTRYDVKGRAIAWTEISLSAAAPENPVISQVKATYEGDSQRLATYEAVNRQGGRASYLFKDKFVYDAKSRASSYRETTFEGDRLNVVAPEAGAKVKSLEWADLAPARKQEVLSDIHAGRLEAEGLFTFQDYDRLDYNARGALLNASGLTTRRGYALSEFSDFNSWAQVGHSQRMENAASAARAESARLMESAQAPVAALERSVVRAREELGSESDRTHATAWGRYNLAQDNLAAAQNELSAAQSARDQASWQVEYMDNQINAYRGKELFKTSYLTGPAGPVLNWKLSRAEWDVISKAAAGFRRELNKEFPADMNPVLFFVAEKIYSMDEQGNVQERFVETATVQTNYLDSKTGTMRWETHTRSAVHQDKTLASASAADKDIAQAVRGVGNIFGNAAQKRDALAGLFEQRAAAQAELTRRNDLLAKAREWVGEKTTALTAAGDNLEKARGSLAGLVQDLDGARRAYDSAVAGIRAAGEENLKNAAAAAREELRSAAARLAEQELSLGGRSLRLTAEQAASALDGGWLDIGGGRYDLSSLQRFAQTKTSLNDQERFARLNLDEPEKSATLTWRGGLRLDGRSLDPGDPASLSRLVSAAAAAGDGALNLELSGDGTASLARTRSQTQDADGRVTAQTLEITDLTRLGGETHRRVTVQETTGYRYDARGRALAYTRVTTEPGSADGRTTTETLLSASYDDAGRLLSSDTRVAEKTAETETAALLSTRGVQYDSAGRVSRSLQIRRDVSAGAGFVTVQSVLGSRTDSWGRAVYSRSDVLETTEADWSLRGRDVEEGRQDLLGAFGPAVAQTTVWNQAFNAAGDATRLLRLTRRTDARAPPGFAPGFHEIRERVANAYGPGGRLAQSLTETLETGAAWSNGFLQILNKSHAARVETTKFSASGLALRQRTTVVENGRSTVTETTADNVYDVQGRLTQTSTRLTPPEGLPTESVWKALSLDARGRALRFERTSVLAGLTTVETSLEDAVYDEQGRLLNQKTRVRKSAAGEETQEHAEESRPLAYDLFGRIAEGETITTKNLPGGVVQTNADRAAYLYDAQGRAVNTVINGTETTAAGGEKRVKYYGSAQDALAFDRNNRPVRVRNLSTADGSPNTERISLDDIRYDDRGRVAGSRDVVREFGAAADGSFLDKYTTHTLSAVAYDAFDRRTGYTNAVRDNGLVVTQRVFGLRYDAAGRLLESRTDTLETSADPSIAYRRASETAQTGMVYDAFGNLLDYVKTVTEGELVTVHKPVFLRYDQEGRAEALLERVTDNRGRDQITGGLEMSYNSLGQLVRGRQIDVKGSPAALGDPGKLQDLVKALAAGAMESHQAGRLVESLGLESISSRLSLEDNRYDKHGRLIFSRVSQDQAGHNPDPKSESKSYGTLEEAEAARRDLEARGYTVEMQVYWATERKRAAGKSKLGKTRWKDVSFISGVTLNTVEPDYMQTHSESTTHILAFDTLNRAIRQTVDTSQGDVFTQELQSLSYDAAGRLARLEKAVTETQTISRTIVRLAAAPGTRHWLRLPWAKRFITTVETNTITKSFQQTQEFEYDAGGNVTRESFRTYRDSSALLRDVTTVNDNIQYNAQGQRVAWRETVHSTAAPGKHDVRQISNATYDALGQLRTYDHAVYEQSGGQNTWLYSESVVNSYDGQGRLSLTTADRSWGDYGGGGIQGLDDEWKNGRAKVVTAYTYYGNSNLMSGVHVNAAGTGGHSNGEVQAKGIRLEYAQSGIKYDSQGRVTGYTQKVTQVEHYNYQKSVKKGLRKKTRGGARTEAVTTTTVVSDIQHDDYGRQTHSVSESQRNDFNKTWSRTETFTRSFDSMGRPLLVERHSVTRQDLGQRTTVTSGSHVRETQAYDAAGNLDRTRVRTETISQWQSVKDRSNFTKVMKAVDITVIVAGVIATVMTGGGAAPFVAAFQGAYQGARQGISINDFEANPDRQQARASRMLAVQTVASIYMAGVGPNLSPVKYVAVKTLIAVGSAAAAGADGKTIAQVAALSIASGLLEGGVNSPGSRMGFLDALQSKAVLGTLVSQIGMNYGKEKQRTTWLVFGSAVQSSGGEGNAGVNASLGMAKTYLLQLYAKADDGSGRTDRDRLRQGLVHSAAGELLGGVLGVVTSQISDLFVSRGPLPPALSLLPLGRPLAAVLGLAASSPDATQGPSVGEGEFSVSRQGNRIAAEGDLSSPMPLDLVPALPFRTERLPQNSGADNVQVPAERPALRDAFQGSKRTVEAGYDDWIETDTQEGLARSGATVGATAKALSILGKALKIIVSAPLTIAKGLFIGSTEMGRRLLGLAARPEQVGDAVFGLKSTVMGAVSTLLSGDIFDKQPMTKDGRYAFDRDLEKPNVMVINGMANSASDGAKMTSLVKTAFGVEEAVRVANNTNFTIAGDVLQSLFYEVFGAYDKAVLNTRDAMRQAIQEKNEVYVVAHSQGTMVFLMAVRQMSPEERRKIHYYGAGSEAFVNADEWNLASARNVWNKGDKIPKLANNINPITFVNINGRRRGRDHIEGGDGRTSWAIIDVDRTHTEQPMNRHHFQTYYNADMGQWATGQLVAREQRKAVASNAMGQNLADTIGLGVGGMRLLGNAGLGLESKSGLRVDGRPTVQDENGIFNFSLQQPREQGNSGQSVRGGRVSVPGGGQTTVSSQIQTLGQDRIGNSSRWFGVQGGKGEGRGVGNDVGNILPSGNNEILGSAMGGKNGLHGADDVARNQYPQVRPRIRGGGELNEGINAADGGSTGGIGWMRRFKLKQMASGAFSDDGQGIQDQKRFGDLRLFEGSFERKSSLLSRRDGERSGIARRIGNEKQGEPASVQSPRQAYFWDIADRDGIGHIADSGSGYGRRGISAAHNLFARIPRGWTGLSRTGHDVSRSGIPDTSIESEIRGTDYKSKVTQRTSLGKAQSLNNSPSVAPLQRAASLFGRAAEAVRNFFGRLLGKPPAREAAPRLVSPLASFGGAEPSARTLTADASRPVFADGRVYDQGRFSWDGEAWRLEGRGRALESGFGGLRAEDGGRLPVIVESSPRGIQAMGVDWEALEGRRLLVEKPTRLPGAGTVFAGSFDVRDGGFQFHEGSLYRSEGELHARFVTKQNGEPAHFPARLEGDSFSLILTETKLSTGQTVSFAGSPLTGRIQDGRASLNAAPAAARVSLSDKFGRKAQGEVRVWLAEDGLKIRGLVSGQTSIPVSLVSGSPQAADSAVAGAAAPSDLPAGRYRVMAEKAGHYFLEGEVAVAETGLAPFSADTLFQMARGVGYRMGGVEFRQDDALPNQFFKLTRRVGIRAPEGGRMKDLATGHETVFGPANEPLFFIKPDENGKKTVLSVQGQVLPAGMQTNTRGEKELDVMLGPARVQVLLETQDDKTSYVSDGRWRAAGDTTAAHDAGNAAVGAMTFNVGRARTAAASLWNRAARARSEGLSWRETAGALWQDAKNGARQIWNEDMAGVRRTQRLAGLYLMRNGIGLFKAGVNFFGTKSIPYFQPVPVHFLKHVRLKGSAESVVDKADTFLAAVLNEADKKYVTARNQGNEEVGFYSLAERKGQFTAPQMLARGVGLGAEQLGQGFLTSFFGEALEEYRGMNLDEAVLKEINIGWGGMKELAKGAFTNSYKQAPTVVEATRQVTTSVGAIGLMAVVPGRGLARGYRAASRVTGIRRVASGLKTMAADSVLGAVDMVLPLPIGVDAGDMVRGVAGEYRAGRVRESLGLGLKDDIQVLTRDGRYVYLRVMGDDGASLPSLARLENLAQRAAEKNLVLDLEIAGGEAMARELQARPEYMAALSREGLARVGDYTNGLKSGAVNLRSAAVAEEVRFRSLSLKKETQYRLVDSELAAGRAREAKLKSLESQGNVRQTGAYLAEAKRNLSGWKRWKVGLAELRWRRAERSLQNLERRAQRVEGSLSDHAGNGGHPQGAGVAPRTGLEGPGGARSAPSRTGQGLEGFEGALREGRARKRAEGARERAEGARERAEGARERAEGARARAEGARARAEGARARATGEALRYLREEIQQVETRNGALEGQRSRLQDEIRIAHEGEASARGRAESLGREIEVYDGRLSWLQDRARYLTEDPAGRRLYENALTLTPDFRGLSSARPPRGAGDASLDNFPLSPDAPHPHSAFQTVWKEFGRLAAAERGSFLIPERGILSALKDFLSSEKGQVPGAPPPALGDFSFARPKEKSPKGKDAPGGLRGLFWRRSDTPAPQRPIGAIGSDLPLRQTNPLRPPQGAPDVNNALPVDGLFARAMQSRHAEAFLKGEGNFAGRNAYITKASDLDGAEAPIQIADRLKLTKKVGESIELSRDADTVIVFEYDTPTRAPPDLRVPTLEDGKSYPFTTGGAATGGGASQWLVGNGSVMDLQAKGFRVKEVYSVNESGVRLAWKTVANPDGTYSVTEKILTPPKNSKATINSISFSKRFITSLSELFSSNAKTANSSGLMNRLESQTVPSTARSVRTKQDLGFQTFPWVHEAISAVSNAQGSGLVPFRSPLSSLKSFVARVFRKAGGEEGGPAVRSSGGRDGLSLYLQGFSKELGEHQARAGGSSSSQSLSTVLEDFGRRLEDLTTEKAPARPRSDLTDPKSLELYLKGFASDIEKLTSDQQGKAMIPGDGPMDALNAYLARAFRKTDMGEGPAAPGVSASYLGQTQFPPSAASSSRFDRSSNGFMTHKVPLQEGNLEVVLVPSKSAYSPLRSDAAPDAWDAPPVPGRDISFRLEVKHGPDGDEIVLSRPGKGLAGLEDAGIGRPVGPGRIRVQSRLEAFELIRKQESLSKNQLNGLLADLSRELEALAKNEEGKLSAGPDRSNPGLLGNESGRVSTDMLLAPVLAPWKAAKKIFWKSGEALERWLPERWRAAVAERRSGTQMAALVDFQVDLGKGGMTVEEIVSRYHEVTGSRLSVDGGADGLGILGGYRQGLETLDTAGKESGTLQLGTGRDIGERIPSGSVVERHSWANMGEDGRIEADPPDITRSKLQSNLPADGKRLQSSIASLDGRDSRIAVIVSKIQRYVRNSKLWIFRMGKNSAPAKSGSETGYRLRSDKASRLGIADNGSIRIGAWRVAEEAGRAINEEIPRVAVQYERAFQERSRLREQKADAGGRAPSDRAGNHPAGAGGQAAADAAAPVYIGKLSSWLEKQRSGVALAPGLAAELRAMKGQGRHAEVFQRVMADVVEDTGLKIMIPEPDARGLANLAAGAVAKPEWMKAKSDPQTRYVLWDDAKARHGEAYLSEHGSRPVEVEVEGGRRIQAASDAWGRPLSKDVDPTMVEGAGVVFRDPAKMGYSTRIANEALQWANAKLKELGYGEVFPHGPANQFSKAQSLAYPQIAYELTPEGALRRYHISDERQAQAFFHKARQPGSPAWNWPSDLSIHAREALGNQRGGISTDIFFAAAERLGDGWERFRYGEAGRRARWTGRLDQLTDLMTRWEGGEIRDIHGARDLQKFAAEYRQVTGKRLVLDGGGNDPGLLGRSGQRVSPVAGSGEAGGGIQHQPHEVPRSPDAGVKGETGMVPQGAGLEAARRSVVGGSRAEVGAGRAVISEIRRLERKLAGHDQGSLEPSPLQEGPSAKGVADGVLRPEERVRGFRARDELVSWTDRSDFMRQENISRGYGAERLAELGKLRAAGKGGELYRQVRNDISRETGISFIEGAVSEEALTMKLRYGDKAVFKPEGFKGKTDGAFITRKGYAKAEDAAWLEAGLKEGRLKFDRVTERAAPVLWLKDSATSQWKVVLKDVDLTGIGGGGMVRAGGHGYSTALADKFLDYASVRFKQAGLEGVWPHSAANFYGKADPLAKELHTLVEPYRDGGVGAYALPTEQATRWAMDRHGMRMSEAWKAETR